MNPFDHVTFARNTPASLRYVVVNADGQHIGRIQAPSHHVALDRANNVFAADHGPVTVRIAD